MEQKKQPEAIGLTLAKYKVKRTEGKRPINERWETAKEFGEYVGLPTTFVLRLFKIYGIDRTLSIKSWLFDVPHDTNRGGKIALAHWRLKQLRDAKK